MSHETANDRNGNQIEDARASAPSAGVNRAQIASTVVIAQAYMPENARGVGPEDLPKASAENSRRTVGAEFVLESPPQPHCELCGAFVGDLERRTAIALGEAPPRSRCAGCDADDYSWCPDCFVRWRPGFTPLVNASRNVGSAAPPPRCATCASWTEPWERGEPFDFS